MNQDTDRSPNREAIVQRLAEDLIGPRSTEEALVSRPSDVYLTGILWPRQTHMSGEEDERLGVAGNLSAEDDGDAEAGQVPASSINKPSVAGISFCFVAEDTPSLAVVCSYARYAISENAEDGTTMWVRKPIDVRLDDIDFSEGSRYLDLEGEAAEGDGVRLHVRCTDGGDRKLATVSLINSQEPGEGRNEMESATLFQTTLQIIPLQGTRLVPKLSSRTTWDTESHADADERSGSLLFRNVHEFASGHTCSAMWSPEQMHPDGLVGVEWIETSWMPSSIVIGVDNKGHELFAGLDSESSQIDPLSASALAHASDSDLLDALLSLCASYRDWIDKQSAKLDSLDDGQRTIAEQNLRACSDVAERMESAARTICSDPPLRHAFRLANLAMDVQHGWDPEKAATGGLRWRPFQLAFLLLSSISSAERDHAHRQVMDLLWFPTGGGKTEAYLALIAFVAFFRRMSDDESDHVGVAALMRYTLRLLTTQQFARSAAMILACEAIRRGSVDAPKGPPLRGDEEFSVGLWVGSEATPNRRAEAYASLNGAGELASPKQLATCPSCRKPLEWSQNSPADPVICSCSTPECVLIGNLPVWTVDDDVYEARPTLLIGTVDKFAQIVRRAETNRLFSVDRGSPPDLIIQDELHLISGPLGTIAGLYESAFDLMFAAGGAKPKVIGSTATIRRASEQVRDLFDRVACQFPPPAIDHDDSGFAVLDEQSTGRRYIGVTTAGRSAKFTLQAVAASLLQSAAAAFDRDADRDPYWTLVGYFNSLRELGGALVLMQDDVNDTVGLLSTARDEPARSIGNVEELTSRRTQQEILDMLGTLNAKVGQAGALDAILATNMVSVGVDIPRLGLMVVNGQPKAIAEYIQSTSRVGRGRVSGLVATVLNNAKARDRSRFETFAGWHRTLYRDVEATSVTPFASRARDRALHAALVAAVRHLVPGHLARPYLDEDAINKAQELIEKIVERAQRIDSDEHDVRLELEGRLKEWAARDPDQYWNDYKIKESLLQSAEVAARKKALGWQIGAAWPTLNSMRNVEAGTLFRMAPVLRQPGGGNGK